MICSTNAPAAPWPSSLPPAYRITSLNNIQHSLMHRPCTTKNRDTFFLFLIFHLLKMSVKLTDALFFSFLHRLIFKCVMCDTVFTNKNLLHVHFDSHLINQKVHVYKCPECTKLFSQRNSLLDHFKVSACSKSFLYICMNKGCLCLIHFFLIQL